GHVFVDGLGVKHGQVLWQSSSNHRAGLLSAVPVVCPSLAVHALRDSEIPAWLECGRPVPYGGRMQRVLDYIDEHRQAFVGQLAEWVKIPAISSDPSHAADMVKNAEFLMADLRKLGADRLEMWPTKGHPAVFASFMHAPGKPTLLV